MPDKIKRYYNVHDVIAHHLHFDSFPLYSSLFTFVTVNPVPDWFSTPSPLTSTTTPPDELTLGALDHQYWGDIGTSAFLFKSDITNW